MNLIKELIYQIELHSVEGIKASFENGINPNDFYDDKPIFDLLISMYTRSPRFKDCVKVFVDNGLNYENKALLAVLLDDSNLLEKQLQKNKSVISEKVNLDCSYTPLIGASLLHVCSEFNSVNCAKVLIKYDADVNSTSIVDEHGFGGQTPIFHTVNQNHNNSEEMLDLLLVHSADLDITVKGIVWGKNYPWETLIPAVNPISYTMFGLLPQMHRDEKIISRIVEKLIKHKYGIEYKLKNIPNKYLTE